MIKLSNVNFSYRDGLFNNLTLTLHSGIYGLLGKNGAGKSTLLKLISGVVFPQSGEMSVLGYNSSFRDKKMLQEILLVTEDNIKQELTGKIYFEIYSRFYPRFDIDKFWQIIDEFDINLTIRLSNLSEGNRKKFFIAFALSSNCKIIMLDEPTNGLDIMSKAIFRKLISSTINEDSLIIISSHHVKDLANLIDPIIILDNGKVILNNSVLEIENKIVFLTGSKLPENQTILYSNNESDGIHYATMRNNENQFGTQIDLEVLFHVVIKHPQLIRDIFGEYNGL